MTTIELSRPAPSPGPSTGELAALLRKYQLLLVWRARRDGASEDHAKDDDEIKTAQLPVAETDRRALRDLAHEFPGALRELDVLGLAEIARRVERLRDRVTMTVEAGGNLGIDDSWVEWILAYHGLMRAALVVKRASGRTRRQLSGAELALTLEAARGHFERLEIDEAFVRAVITPPGRRLTAVVLVALGRHFGAPAAEISRTLFPPRR
jgi:hypothetical protein